MINLYLIPVGMAIPPIFWAVYWAFQQFRSMTAAISSLKEAVEQLSAKEVGAIEAKVDLSPLLASLKGLNQSITGLKDVMFTPPEPHQDPPMSELRLRDDRQAYDLFDTYYRDLLEQGMDPEEAKNKAGMYANEVVAASLSGGGIGFSE